MLMMLMLLLLLDLGFVGSSQQAIGESGGEESEDEWNYIKVDKKSSDGLAAVEEISEPIAESTIVEEKEEEVATALIENLLNETLEEPTEPIDNQPSELEEDNVSK
jgi:hypothetical protein